MNMDLMQLETFLGASSNCAAEEANRHLSEKARHEDEARKHQEIAIFCGRAATRIRGLREYLRDAPSGLTIDLMASIETGVLAVPAPVDERAPGPVPGGDDDAQGAAPFARAEAGAEGDAGRKNSRAIALEVIDRMAVLWDEGKTVREIAKAVGLTKGTVAGVTFRLRDRFPKREPVPFKPKPATTQSPMAERLVPRPVPAPYNPTAIGNVREIAPLMNEMRAFFAKCEAKQPGGGIHEVASLEIRFNTTDLRIERALTALAAAGEIEWSASLKGHVTVRALKMVEAAE